jgi:hypothetical protein
VLIVERSHRQLWRYTEALRRGKTVAWTCEPCGFGCTMISVQSMSESFEKRFGSDADLWPEPEPHQFKRPGKCNLRLVLANEYNGPQRKQA